MPSALSAVQTATPLPANFVQGINTGNVAGMLEYQAAYQAAYHAALQQQAAAMLQQQGGPGHLGALGQFGGNPGSAFSSSVAAHMAGPAFFANPSVTNAAAAAAASAVQNLMGGASGLTQYHIFRRPHAVLC